MIICFTKKCKFRASFNAHEEKMSGGYGMGLKKYLSRFMITSNYTNEEEKVINVVWN